MPFSCKEGIDGRADLGEDVVRREHQAVLVGAVDADEMRVAGGFGAVQVPDRLLEADVRLVDVLAAVQVVAVLALAVRRQALFHKADGDVQEEVQIRFRKVEIAVLRLEDPVAQADALLAMGKFRTLVGDVGIDVAVQEDDLAGVERRTHRGCGTVAVLREKQGNELRMHGVDAAELALEEAADEVAVHRGWRKKAIRQLEPHRPKAILDIATGTGDFAILAAEMLHPERLIGADISEGMMQIGRQKVAERGLDGIITFEKPNFSEDSVIYRDRLSERFLRANNPFRMLIDKVGFKPGADLLFGSDGMPHGIRFALSQALFPPYPGQKLTLSELVSGYCTEKCGELFEFDAEEVLQ